MYESFKVIYAYNCLVSFSARKTLTEDTQTGFHQPNKQLKSSLALASLKACSSMHIVTFVFKCVHSNTTELFKEYFVKSSHNYSTRRNGLHILLPNVYTETAKKGCYNYFRKQAFNNLHVPSCLKETESLLIFKTTLIVKDFFSESS